MKEIYYYYTPTVRRTARAQLVPASELSRLRGFRSVFGYGRKAIERIKATGSVRHLQEYPVKCTEVLVDFDNQPAAVAEARKFLERKFLSYQEFESGNRSVHFNIPCTYIGGVNIAYRVKCWVAQNFPKADLTIYHNSAIFRLPGTWHEKNPGHRKTLTRIHFGRFLEVPAAAERPETWRKNSLTFSKEDAILKLGAALDRIKREGGRRFYAWYICNLMVAAELPDEDVRRILLTWNQRKAIPPLPEEVLWQKLEEARSGLAARKPSELLLKST